jgi:hypothetical protein
VGNQTFELERFVWATPDRLEIDGRFVGLGEAPSGQPVLVLRGAERTHRLPAVTEGAANGDAEGWHAAFSWQEAPTAFDAVELEFGDELLVELPEPGSDSEASELGLLDVRRRRGGAERLRLQGDLLAVRSELGELRALQERLEKELARAREDLAAERAARAGDAERFRADLAHAQETAEETLADALGEVERLNARVVELAHTGEEAERMRARLTAVRELLDETEEDPRDAGGEAAS